MTLHPVTEAWNVPGNRVRRENAQNVQTVVLLKVYKSNFKYKVKEMITIVSKFHIKSFVYSYIDCLRNQVTQHGPIRLQKFFLGVVMSTNYTTLANIQKKVCNLLGHEVPTSCTFVVVLMCLKSRYFSMGLIIYWYICRSGVPDSVQLRTSRGGAV